MFPTSDYEVLLHTRQRTRELQERAAAVRLAREARRGRPRRPRVHDYFLHWLGLHLIALGGRLQARTGDAVSAAALTDGRCEGRMA